MSTSSRDVTIHLKKEPSTSTSTPSGESTSSGRSIITASKISSQTLPCNPKNPLSTITIRIDDEDSMNLYDPFSLAPLVPSLRNDGNGRIYLSIPSNLNSGVVSVIHTSITLAGLSPETERMEGTSSRVISAVYKPKTGQNTAVKIKTIAQPKVQINIGDFTTDEEEDDLINEDDLLQFGSTNGVVNAPEEVDVQARKKQLDDCGGRKACDDCTCGRAEMEAAEATGETKSNSNTVPKTSNCGNCSMGDAFRCAGCPFLGKPAFKAGEEHLVLDLTDDL